MPNSNRNLQDARNAKKDEFYTQLPDIELELSHYTRHFRGKTVLCNCDDPRESKFFHYFSHNFHELKLKKLITTCYKNKQMNLFTRNDSKRAVYLEYDGSMRDKKPDPRKIGIYGLIGDGDFRSTECIEILKASDIVVTNPPFSLFREYLAQLVKYRKKFLIIGPQTVIARKTISEFIRDDKLWLGYYSGNMEFQVPNNYPPRKTRYWQDESGQKWRSLGNTCWFTNLDIKKRHEILRLHEKYNPADYPKYDNYDAINVDRVADIPADYAGKIGVPITFMNKYNPDQFEILGMDRYVEDNPNYGHSFKINGRETYARLMIRTKRGKGERKA